MAEDVAVPDAIQKSKGYTELAVFNGQAEALRLRRPVIGADFGILGVEDQPWQ